MVKLFNPTASKRLIRNQIDLPAIHAEFKQHNRTLTYFGLPSEGLYDVRAWKRYIGKIVAVEKGDPYDPERRQSLLLSRAVRLGLDDRLILLRGELNSIILRGQDEIGQKVEYPFELANFDYGGALLYPDRSRVRALERFVREQQGSSFLFLMTVNIREYDSQEITKTQQRIKSELDQISTAFANIEDFFKIVNSSAYPLRQIVHTLYLLKGLSEANHYKIKWERPVIYFGTSNTQLIHYIVDFEFDPSASTKVVSQQSLMDIIKLRTRLLRGTRINDIQIQIPNPRMP